MACRHRFRLHWRGPATPLVAATVSQAAFDPCRQWLGIDAVELGDPRRVIGVSPGESDPLAVLRAAEARLTLLRGLSAGPFELARNALIKRVEEAREAVLHQLATMPRDAFSAPITFNMPPAPTGYPSAPAGVSAPPPPVPPAVPPPVPAAPSWLPPTQLPAAVPATGFGGPRVSPRYRRQSSSGGLLALLAGLAVVAAALAISVLQPKAEKPPNRRPPPQNVAQQEPRPPAAEGEQDDERGGRDEPVERRRPRPVRPPKPVEEPIEPTSDRAVSTSEPPVRMDSLPPDGTETKPPAVEQPGDDATAAVADAGMRAERTTTAKPDDEAAPAGNDGGDAATQAATSGTPEAPADTAAAASMERKDGADETLLRIESLLGEAHAALQRREHDTVDRKLAAAEKIAPDRAAAERIARWRSFAHYAKEFYAYREQALNAVEAGHEYDVDGKKIGVVEIDAEKFIYRFKGRNVTKPRDNIPAGIVLAIVNDWFDARPENQLFLGAYHLSKPECDPQAARTNWELGQAAGADASQLLPLLDDPVIRRAAAQ
jgi:hypothetical protein